MCFCPDECTITVAQENCALVSAVDSSMCEAIVVVVV